MHWSSWSAFWSMGGYGLYVWGSYGITVVLLVGEVLSLLKHKRAAVGSKAEAGDIRVTGIEASS